MPIVTLSPPAVPSVPSFTGVTINDLNLGPNLGVNPLETVEFKQTLSNAQIRGGSHSHWAESSEPIEFEGNLQVTSPNARGGFAANSQGALTILLQQLQELVANPFLSPQYIQWDPAGPSIFDGWWLTSDLRVTRWNKVSGRALVYLKTTFLLAGSTRRAAYYAVGGVRPSTATQASSAIKAVWFPPSLSGANSYSRTGAEGVLTAAKNPPVNPIPVQQPSDPTSYWSGGARVFDTQGGGTNLPNQGGPLIPLVLTAAVGATGYHAGTFTVGYTLVYGDGTESTLSPTTQVTLTAGQQINVGGWNVAASTAPILNAPTSIKVYFTVVPAGDTTGFVVQRPIVSGSPPSVAAFSATAEGNGTAAPASWSPNFTNANWQEVKHPELHRFANDIVITNGLVMVYLGLATRVVNAIAYWNNGWQPGVQLVPIDSARNAGSLMQVTFTQIAPEEVGFEMLFQTPIGNFFRPGHGLGNIEAFRCRMQRGVPGILFDYAPLTESAGDFAVIYDVYSNTLTPIIYATTNASGPINNASGPTASTDYCFAGFFWPDARCPFVASFHYQNPSGGTNASTLDIGISSLGSAVKLADSTATAGTYRPYALMLAPFGSSSQLIVNLPGSGTTGVYSGGVVTAADAAAYGGSAAKIPNTTVAGALDDQLINQILPAGTYALYARLRVTANASAVSWIKVAVKKSGVDQLSVSYAPNQLLTTYPTNGTHIKVGTFTADGSSTYDAYVTNTATADTDLFIDMLVAGPLTDSASTAWFPEDLWLQMMYDLSQSLEVS